jgi:HK97 family phage major capsid protein
MNRLQEIETRMKAIATELDADGADIDALETEVNELKEERKLLQEKVEKRTALLAKVNEGAGKILDIIPDNKEERKVDRTPEQVYASPEYRSAFFKTLQGKPLNEVEQREFTLVPNTAGAVVPTDTANMIFDQMTKIVLLVILIVESKQRFFDFF